MPHIIIHVEPHVEHPVWSWHIVKTLRLKLMCILQSTALKALQMLHL